MAQYTGTFSIRPMTLVLTVSLASQSQVNNTSTLSCSLVIQRHPSWTSFELDANSTYVANIDGQVVSGAFAYDFRQYDSLLLRSWSVTVAHDSAGYKTVASSASVDANVIGDAACSGSLVLPRIPRPPSAPGTPTVSNVGPTNATLAWTAPTNNNGAAVDNYQVQVDETSTFSSPLISVNDSASPYGATSLVPGTTYYARVRAHNVAGWGAWSGTRQFTTLSGAKIRVAGAWVDAPAHVRSAGAWVIPVVNKRNAGAWVT